jgi:Transposase and inactivated derivatives
MKAYSQDFRDKIILAREKESCATVVAKRFGVSKSYVSRCWKRIDSCGVNHAYRQGGYKVSKLSKISSTIKAWLRKQPDMTLEQMQQRCEGELGIAVGRMTMWDHLDRMGLTFKKNSSRSRARQARRDGTSQILEAKPVSPRRKKAGVS